MDLTFFKLDGAGNDFVGLDWRDQDLPSGETLPRLTRLLCDRHHGVGADGVILLGTPPPDGRFHFTMKYLNADGSAGSMCGNGARCAAVFAHARGAAPEKMRFLTDAGPYEAELIDGGSRVSFPPVEMLPERRVLEGPGRPLAEVEFLRVGVPHAVAFVEDLDLLNVKELGRPARHDPALAPEGANVNFAEERSGVLHVRTYERGVEDETLACGTGSVAVVCCHIARHNLTGLQSFRVVPTGGIPLEITVRRQEGGFGGITLAGAARVVFEGRCRVNPEAGLASVTAPASA